MVNWKNSKKQEKMNKKSLVDLKEEVVSASFAANHKLSNKIIKILPLLLQVKY